MTRRVALLGHPVAHSLSPPMQNAAFRALEPQSVYTRVFHMKKDLSAGELRQLTEVDPATEMALVVTSSRLT